MGMTMVLPWSGPASRQYPLPFQRGSELFTG